MPGNDAYALNQKNKIKIFINYCFTKREQERKNLL